MFPLTKEFFVLAITVALKELSRLQQIGGRAESCLGGRLSMSSCTV
jgi:hypothetical protein